MNSERYWEMFHLIRGDVESAVASNAAYLLIGSLLEEHQIAEKFNRNGDYWQLTMFALQGTFFIALGRIFDKRKDVHCIQDLVHFTSEHPGFFSKDELRKTKIKACGGKAEDWLDDYVARAWEPTRKDLQPLEKALSPHINRFEEIYKPIRDVYFAHRGKASTQAIHELFSRTVINDVDETLSFLYTLMRAIQEMADNGKEPDLEDFSHYQAFVKRQREQTERVIRSLT